MLYLVPTPIGNLKDITFRAIEVLNECDLIYAENTSKSSILLNHYGIKTPCKSYHKFSEAKKLDPIISQLEDGKNIALISDAGTPGICDPGALLVKTCLEKKLAVTSLPGACALSVAASLSGSEKPFQFLGFVPKKANEKKAFLEQMQDFDGHSYAYETPHQIAKTLKLLGKYEVAVYREMSKIYEEIICGFADEIEIMAKGEMVLRVEGKPKKSSVDEESIFSILTTQYSLSPSASIKLISQLFDLNKNDLYKKFIT